MAQGQNIRMRQYGSSSLLRGALAGLVATLPMTLFMLLIHQLLPKWQQYALPPEEITDELAERADLKKHMDKEQKVGAALVAHFGYGAAMGALYSIFTNVIPLPAVMKGTLFGLVVWAGSYLGLIPAMDISTSADKEPMRRNLMMIAAHIVWGSATGVIANVLGRPATE